MGSGSGRQHGVGTAANGDHESAGHLHDALYPVQHPGFLGERHPHRAGSPAQVPCAEHPHPSTHRRGRPRLCSWYSPPPPPLPCPAVCQSLHVIHVMRWSQHHSYSHYCCCCCYVAADVMSFWMTRKTRPMMSWSR